MRDRRKLLGCMLAGLLSTNVSGQALTPPASPDPVFSKGFDGSFIVPNTGGVSFLSGVDLVAADRSLVSVVTNNGGVSVTGYAWHADGSAAYEDPLFTVEVPYDITSVIVVNGNMYLSGLTGQGPVLMAIDVKTGLPTLAPVVLSLPLPGYIIGDVRTLELNTGDKSRLVGKSTATGPLLAIVAAASNATFTDYRSGVFLFDPATGGLVSSFGNGGSAFVQGNFDARWGAVTADGVVIGGKSRLDPAHPGIGVANFDTQGNPGTCGSTVKEVLPRTDQFVLPDTTGGFFDPGSGLVTFVGEASGSVFFGRQLKRDCTLNTTTFTYPKAVFAGGVAAVTADTMAVVLNEVGNGTSAAHVALYNMSGGAPTAVSPMIVNSDTAPTGNTAGARRAKAVSVSNTNALRIAVQPDAKIVIAGTTDALGGSAFVARFIGVQVITNVIEFHNTTLDHYFLTADPIEATAIDGGSAGPGWSRTGQTWKSGGPDRVCRFYGVQAAGGPNGHFYTIDSAECAAVRLDPGWHFESYDFSGWPVSSPGVCPIGTIPVKRAYNGRFAQHDSNHRYSTSDTIYNQMVAQGWSGEGVVFCSVQ
jgi:Repeat of unknown function (DUF5648)